MSEKQPLLLIAIAVCLVLIFQPTILSSLSRKVEVPSRVLSSSEMQLSAVTAQSGELVISGTNGVLIDQGSQAIRVGKSSITALTASIERLRIDSSGNVGIGTTNPQSTLHVAGPLTCDWNMYMKGTDFFMTNSSRGTGGRALVHDVNNKLTINYNGDFSGGVNVVIPQNNTVYSSDSYTGQTLENWGLNVAPAGQSWNGDGGRIAQAPSINLRAADLAWSGVNLPGSQIIIEGGISNRAASTGASIKLLTGNSERMRILANGYVGIGVSNPSFPLQISNYKTVNYSSVSGLAMQLAMTTSDGGNWFIGQNTGGANSNMYFVANVNTNGFSTTEVCGYIENDTAGIRLMNFTGQHRCAYDDTIDSVNSEGLIVCATGKYWSLIDTYDNTSQIDHITTNETLPQITLASRPQSKNVFGVISYTEDPENTRTGGIGRFKSMYTNPRGEKSRVFVNSLGEGAVWVCDANGSFENGDYITTSSVPGYGMRQSSDSLMNYTMGKITMDCDFQPQLLPVYVLDENNKLIESTDKSGTPLTKPAYKIRYLTPKGDIISQTQYITLIQNGNRAYRAALVGCTYHCG